MSLHVFPCREYIHTVLNCGAYANRLCSRLPLSFNSNAASVSPGLFPRVHIYQPRRIRFSQSCVTSIDALSSPGKRAGEWEINCQTMHRSITVLIMSDDIEALPDVWLHNLPHPPPQPPPPPPPLHCPHPSCTLWWICGPCHKRLH